MRERRVLWRVLTIVLSVVFTPPGLVVGAVGFTAVPIPTTDEITRVQGNHVYVYWIEKKNNRDVAFGRISASGELGRAGLGEQILGPSTMGPDGSFWYYSIGLGLHRIEPSSAGVTTRWGEVKWSDGTEVAWNSTAMAVTDDGVYLGGGTPLSSSPYASVFQGPASWGSYSMKKSLNAGTRFVGDMIADAGIMGSADGTLATTQAELTHFQKSIDNKAIRSWDIGMTLGRPFIAEFVFGFSRSKALYVADSVPVGGPGERLHTTEVIEFSANPLSARKVYPASSAQISAIGDGVVDADYNLWFPAKRGSQWFVVQISENGVVTEHLPPASAGPPDDTNPEVTLGPNGTLWYASKKAAQLVRIRRNCTPPLIVANPINTTAVAGTAELAVTATSSNGALNYQWYVGASGNTQSPTGTNSTRLQLTNVTAATSYWVKVFDVCGQVDSGAAVVTPAATCSVPSIQSQPANASVVAGGAATLSVSASGGGVLQYQWYRGPRGNTATPMPSTTAQLTLANVTSPGTYWVRVTNSCGFVDSNEAVVSISAACPAMSSRNTFISYSDPVSGCSEASGECRSGVPVNFSAVTFNYSFDCSLHTFTWFLADVVIGRGRVMSYAFPGPGRFHVTLVVANSQQTFTTSADVPVTGPENSGSRRRAITRPPGGGGSCVAPAITTQPVSQSVASGATAALSVAASGTGPFTYQWFSGTSGDTSSPVSGATASSFTTPAVSGSRSFWARVSNSCGTVDSATATITLLNNCVSPMITTQPAGASVANGATATLSVSATGAGPLSYQWYSGQSGDVSSPVAGATGAAFTTAAIIETRYFWVRITNTCGSVDSATAVVSVVSSSSTQPFRLNSTTGGVQSFPQVTGIAFERSASPKYGFGATWYSNSAVLAQIVSAQGGSIGSERTISSHPVLQGTQYSLSTSYGGAGGSEAFGLSWNTTSAGAQTPPLGSGLLSLYDETGTRTLATTCVQFDCSATQQGYGGYSKVSMSDEGRMLVTWIVLDRNTCWVEGNWFNLVSHVYGLHFKVAQQANCTLDLGRYAVDAWSNDSLFIVWRSGTELKGQRFENELVPRTSEFVITGGVYNDGRYLFPDVACQPNGDCLVVWTNWDTSTQTAIPVYGRIYDAGGTPRGDSFMISSTGAGTAPPEIPTETQFLSAHAAALPDGDFIVSFTRSGASRSSTWDGVVAQRISKDGLRRGAPIRVRDEPSGTVAYREDIAATADGSFMVVWEEGVGNDTDIWGRIYGPGFGR